MDSIGSIRFQLECLRKGVYIYIRRKIYVEIFFTVFDFYRRDSCSGFTSFSDSRVNRFTSVLPPKKIKVLRPDMKFRKRTPFFLRKLDLRRRNLHPVSVFFIFFDVNPADVNPVRKHSNSNQILCFRMILLPTPTI